MRIGQGYDVHRLTEGRKLILGGVDIPYDKGLFGHSDADVLSHAIMDALLGAAALGDIGQLFPDTDERYAGADSLKLLSAVCAHLRSGDALSSGGGNGCSGRLCEREGYDGGAPRLHRPRRGHFHHGRGVDLGEINHSFSLCIEWGAISYAGGFIMYAIILFRSLTYAQRGSRALSLAGIPSYVMKAPQGLTEKGCGYGVRLNEAKLRRAVALLDERGINRSRAFLLSRLTGEYREVPL